MSLQLFAHPFSSYCQKALIALYEHATPFEFRMLGAELEKRWPLKRFSVLLDDERLVADASIIARSSPYSRVVYSAIIVAWGASDARSGIHRPTAKMSTLQRDIVISFVYAWGAINTSPGMYPEKLAGRATIAIRNRSDLDPRAQFKNAVGG